MREFLDLGDGEQWMDRAACADGDPSEFARDTQRSPLICLGCPVLRECARQADEQGETSGVWGGMDRARVN